MADGTFGGRLFTNFDGTPLTPFEGQFTLRPSRYSSEAVANGDGSTAFVYTPKVPRLEMRFRNVGNVAWSTILERVGNFQAVEELTGTSHLFTAARMTGEPQIDFSTGEVSGLAIEGGTYKEVPA